MSSLFGYQGESSNSGPDGEPLRFDDRNESLLKLQQELVEKSSEIEDLKAKLSTYESTKKVLVGKLREVENVLKRVIDQRDQARAQIISDKKVIAYLDGRTHELEITLDAMEHMKKEIEVELVKEKEETKVLETANKRIQAENKFLAEEVNSLRLQLNQAEQDKRHLLREKRNPF